MSDDRSLDFKHHHGAMSVPNLEESIAWYQRVLGFNVEARFHIAKIPADVAMLRRGPLRIELFQVPDAHPLPEDRRQPDSDNRTHGNKHVAFAVQDAELAERQLRARGADVAMVVKAAHGAGFFIRDNAGNLLEFCQQPDLWQTGLI
jgi:catechol 2,3-dioxygenase-like lactoylglutathione lyase family enzyme